MDTLSNNPKPCGTVTVRAYAPSDLPEMTAIWNEVVRPAAPSRKTSR